MKVKAEPPLTNFSTDGISPLVRTYLEFNHLKQLFRQGWLHRGLSSEKCESVADHSFSTAILALLIRDTHFPDLDLLKVVLMTMLHEVGEIYAGDITPGDGVQADEKHRREWESATQVLEKLSGGSRYITLWEEYEAGETPEARFVRQIDRLEMGLQAAIYARQENIDPEEFYASSAQALTSPPLSALLKELTN